MNIAQNLQAYLTPLFIVFLIAYGAWCFYSMTSKKHRKRFKKLSHNNMDIRREAAKKLTVALGVRLVILVFFVFAYFFAYGPNEIGKNVKPKESGYMQMLESKEGETSTQVELKQDAKERRDETEYLQQVGEPDSLKKEEEENAKLIEETLKKYQ